MFKSSRVADHLLAVLLLPVAAVPRISDRSAAFVVRTDSIPKRGSCGATPSTKNDGLKALNFLVVKPACWAGKRTSESWHWFLRTVKIEGTAGAGFAGLYLPDQIEEPILNPCPKVGTTTPVCAPTASDTSVLLRANRRYSWRPALSTGIEARVQPSGSDLGWGIGAHMVFLPLTQGQTAPYPAATLHLGSAQSEIFIGMVFSPTDIIVFPNGMDTMTVHRTQSSQSPNFIVPGIKRARHLYAGIQINGHRQSEAEAQAATGNPPSNVDSIAISPDSPLTLREGDKSGTHTVLMFAKGHPVMASVRVAWHTGNASVATVDDAGVVAALKEGTTAIVARVGELLSPTIAVVVQKKQ